MIFLNRFCWFSLFCSFQGGVSIRAIEFGSLERSYLGGGIILWDFLNVARFFGKLLKNFFFVSVLFCALLFGCFNSSTPDLSRHPRTHTQTHTHTCARRRHINCPQWGHPFHSFYLNLWASFHSPSCCGYLRIHLFKISTGLGHWLWCIHSLLICYISHLCLCCLLWFQRYCCIIFLLHARWAAFRPEDVASLISTILCMSGIVTLLQTTGCPLGSLWCNVKCKSHKTIAPHICFDPNTVGMQKNT